MRCLRGFDWDPIGGLDEVMDRAPCRRFSAFDNQAKRTCPTKVNSRIAQRASLLGDVIPGRIVSGKAVSGWCVLFVVGSVVVVAAPVARTYRQTLFANA
jgi:hypothetical protein